MNSPGASDARLPASTFGDRTSARSGLSERMSCSGIATPAAQVDVGFILREFLCEKLPEFFIHLLRRPSGNVRYSGLWLSECGKSFILLSGRCVYREGPPSD